MLDVLASSQGADLSNEQVEKSKDLLAEMLAKMGSELGYEFQHTELKNTGYYPKRHDRLDQAAFALRAKGLEILEGKANIGVVIRNEGQPAGGAANCRTDNCAAPPLRRLISGKDRACR